MHMLVVAVHGSEDAMPGRQCAIRLAEEDCDGIPMGTRGMGAMGNPAIGSVTTKAVHSTQLPGALSK
jgi:hypothetical protein